MAVQRERGECSSLFNAGRSISLIPNTNSLVVQVQVALGRWDRVVVFVNNGPSYGRRERVDRISTYSSRGTLAAVGLGAMGTAPLARSHPFAVSSNS